MTQLDNLAFCLLAAGSVQVEGNSTYLLYINPETSALESKLWNGENVEDVGHAETIAESVRPNSTTSYITSPSRLVTYVSSDNELRVCELDEESDEWVDDSAIAQYKVHPQGHAVAVNVNTRICIVFQDTSKRLTIISKVGADGSWTSPTVIPVEPTAGSAIWAGSPDGKQLLVFYVSAKTNCLHYAVEEDGNTWKDNSLEKCTFSDKSKPKRLMVLPGSTPEDWFQLFVMSEEKTVWQFSPAMEKLKKLGNMKGNKFDPDDSEECFTIINYGTINIGGGWGGGWGGGCYRRCW